MILFDLKCRAGHVFEAWFRDGAAFEAAPHVAKTRGEPGCLGGNEGNLAAELVKELERLCRHIESTAEYVGENFSEEARRIKSGESERRDIYGEASESETQELLDEGVEILRVPWIRRRHHS